MVNAIEAFDAKHMKPAEEIPAFRPGDTVEVNVKIQEGTPRPSTPSRWSARVVCVAPSCTTCATCAVRPLVSLSAATTPRSEFQTQIKREIGPQPYGRRAFFYSWPL